MPDIVISSNLFAKINEYALQCPVEISGFGSIIHNSRGDLEVNELFPLLPQTCSGEETDPDLTDLVCSPYSIRVGLWWHSHVNMPCFWSPTDLKCIESLGSTNIKYLLSIVVNKRGEYKARFDYFKPYRMFLDDLTIGSPHYLQKREVDKISKEIKTMVKRPVIIHNGWQNHSVVKQIRKFDDREQTDMFPKPLTNIVEMGEFDTSITKEEEMDWIKAGYCWNDLEKDWIFQGMF